MLHGKYLTVKLNNEMSGVLLHNNLFCEDEVMWRN